MRAWVLGVGLMAVEAAAWADSAVTFTTVQEKARELSRSPFVAPAQDLPQGLRRLDYDAYRAIDYRRSRAVWANKALPFALEFFHRGYLYKDRVAIHVLEDGADRLVPFRPEDFDYRRGRPEGLTENLGLSGLRVLYRWAGGRYDELAVFQGASYFRAVCRGAVFGASARGTAVNTSLAGHEEEFPAFRELWICCPASKDDRLQLYALLDSPSLSGAYQIGIQPGEETLITVRAELFARRRVEKLGLGPLTSMFYYGESEARPARDGSHRPQVHDSDGLAIGCESGEWLWRPLHNPAAARTSSFQAGRPKAFGLLQRDRQASHYSDSRTLPQRRPSVWVEPTGSWSSGRVELLELPAPHEGVDNIVAQYVPDRPLEAGTELKIEYRLRFTLQSGAPHGGAYVTATYLTPASHALSASVEFQGGKLSDLSPQDVTPEVTIQGGTAAGVKLSADAGSYRLQFQVTPAEGAKAVELRAFLRRGREALSETWSDLWNP